MHGITSATTGSTLASTTWPTVAKTPQKRKKAIAMLTIGPPAITTTFCHDRNL